MLLFILPPQALSVPLPTTLTHAYKVETRDLIGCRDRGGVRKWDVQGLGDSQEVSASIAVRCRSTGWGVRLTGLVCYSFTSVHSTKCKRGIRPTEGSWIVVLAM